MRSWVVAMLCFLVLPLLGQEVPEVAVEVQVEAEREKLVKTEEITSSQAQGMVGAQNLSDVLGRLPGTEAVYGCVMASPRLTMRGSTFTSRQILVEGININPIGSCVLDRVPWGAMSKVEVLRGPIPPQFFGSLSGVASVTLKTGDESPGAYFSSSLGSYNTQIYDLFAGGGDKSRNYFIAFNRTAGNEWREKAKTDLSDLSFKIVNAPDETSKWVIVGVMLQGEQAGFYPTGPNPADRYGQRWPTMRRPALSITYKKKTSDRSDISFRLIPLSFSSDLYYMQLASGVAVPYITLLRYKTLRFDIDQNIMLSPHLVFNWGIWWQGDWRRGTVPSPAPDIGPWRKSDMKQKGIYVQSTKSLGERGSFVLGLGYADVDYHSPAPKKPNGSALTPFVTYNTKVNPASLLRFSLARNKRFPILEELYGGGCFRGNPDLQPFLAHNFQIDWESNLPAGKLTVSLFYTKEKNVIGNDKDGNYINIGRARERGMEVSYERSVGNTTFWGNYTYLDAWDLTNDRFLVPAYRTSQPRHMLKMGVSFSGRGGLRWGGEVFYYGKRWTDGEGIPPSVPSAWIFNLKVEKNLPHDRNISLSVNNLFDKQWEEVIFYPQAGRWLLVSFSQKF